MFRLFIVDDNKYERNGIKESIDWQSLGIQVVGTFANGLEALTRIDELKPHIVITDIAMPLMNGVEMSERIRQSHPDVKIIFISCHSDFEFAKSAVDLGIYGYVLKPIIADELERALHKLLAEFTEQHREQMEKERMMQQLEGMLPLVQEQFLKEVLLGNFRNEDDIRQRIEFLALPIIEHATMSVISVKCPRAEGERERQSAMDAYFQSYSIKNRIARSETPERAMVPVQFSAEDYAAIVFDQQGDKQGVIDAAVQLNTSISAELGIQATMGISTCSRELTELERLYKQSQKAVNTRFYSGSNPIILFEEIDDRSDSPFEEMPSLEDVYQDMKALMSFGSGQDIEEFIGKYLNDESAKHGESYVKGFALLFSHLTGILLLESNQPGHFGDNAAAWDKLNRMSTKEDVVQWVRQTFAAIKERLTDRNASRNVKVIGAIKQMIHDNYHEQISIEDISKSVYLSGRHANGLFKKETSQTIFDYLIQFRIEKAKQLLKEEGSKVAAVAEAVGYLNTSYFILAFKKNVGMTPAEFKSKAALPL
ncbi:response regulator transcription factor [Paenibacillus montanisoli]|nr:response regulator [Paenibacillus montanisoli]